MMGDKIFVVPSFACLSDVVDKPIKENVFITSCSAEQASANPNSENTILFNSTCFLTVTHQLLCAHCSHFTEIVIYTTVYCYQTALEISAQRNFFPWIY